jgi:hypothetical protein
MTSPVSLDPTPTKLQPTVTVASGVGEADFLAPTGKIITAVTWEFTNATARENIAEVVPSWGEGSNGWFGYLTIYPHSGKTVTAGTPLNVWIYTAEPMAVSSSTGYEVVTSTFEVTTPSTPDATYVAPDPVTAAAPAGKVILSWTTSTSPALPPEDEANGYLSNATVSNSNTLQGYPSAYCGDVLAGQGQTLTITINLTCINA